MATRGDFIRTGEAAAILGTSRQHVVDLCDQGRLSFERYGIHRRIRRADVEALAAGADAGPMLTRDERQSIWLHGAVASRLVAEPDITLALARANLEQQRRVHSVRSSRWLDAWERVLDDGPEAALEALTSRTREAIDLRQNSPFAGTISDAERRRILTAFREAESRG